MPAQGIDSDITRVTVYRQGARITRRARVSLRRGCTELSLRGLPASLLPGSVAVRLHAGGGWLANGVCVEVEDGALTAEGASTQADAQVSDLAALQAQVRTLEELREQLNKLPFHERAEAASGVSIAGARMSALRFQRDALHDLELRLHKVRGTIDEVTVGSSTPAPALAARIRLQAGVRDADGWLELEYLVPGACWAPGYALHVDERLDSAVLISHAVVAQETGEDWRGAAITFQSAALPPLDPDGRAYNAHDWRLPESWNAFADLERFADSNASTLGNDESLRSSVPPLRYGDVGADGEAVLPANDYLDHDALRLPALHESLRGRLSLNKNHLNSAELNAARERARAVADLPLPERYARARVPDGYHVSYAAEAECNVPSSGCFTPCRIRAQQLSCEARFIAVPRISNQVYREVELGNDGPWPLLEGPLDVYVGEQYWSATKIEHTKAGKSWSLDLGSTHDVEVTRDTSVESQSAGLVRGSKQLQHQIRIEVRNHLDQDITIEIRERVPVPEEGRDEISVRIDRVVPPWRRYAPNRPDRPGRYRWRERLGASESLSLAVDYTVKLPARLNLLGGNRRELR